MKITIKNIGDLELYLLNGIHQIIEQSLNKNTEYQNIDFVRDIFKDEYNDFSNFIKEELLVYTLKLADNDEKIDDPNPIINSHYSYSSREINSNESLSNKYKQFNTKSNLVDYHLSPDKNTLQKLDLLSYSYLVEDLNTTFDEHFFINDLSFLYKVENKNSYLLSFEDYLSYLSNTLAKENNIFNHCIKIHRI